MESSIFSWKGDELGEQGVSLPALAAVPRTDERRRLAGYSGSGRSVGELERRGAQSADAALALSVQFNYSVTLIWVQVGQSLRNEGWLGQSSESGPDQEGRALQVCTVLGWPSDYRSRATQGRLGLGVDERARHRLAVKRKRSDPSQGPTRREGPFKLVLYTDGSA